MPSIVDASAQIVAAGLPVLFADTCVLLDVIRAPIRPDRLRGCIEAAVELLQLVTTPPPRCTLVLASFVPNEWLTNAGPIADDLRKHLTRLDEQATAFHDACGFVGISPPFARPGYDRVPLADGLQDLSRRLRDSAVLLDPDNDCILRAYARASSYMPPSRKGGEIKDSTIIEEYLAICRQLQAAGFVPKRVFCTSNTNDYCESGSIPHPNLAAEFGSVGLTFTTNLPWAVHALLH